MENFITEITEIKNLLKISSVQTITMYRVNFDYKRGYVMVNPFQVYSGLTGALAAATFKGNIESKRIGKWRDKMIAHLGGQDNQEAYLQAMADFGSLCHECLVRIKENGKLDWNEEQTYAAAYFEQSAKDSGITPSGSVIRSQVFEYCKAAAAILQFCYDNVVEIYAIEAMCKDDNLMIATPLDLVCMIKIKNGEIPVSINLKTSSQITNSHREQVAVEKHLWNSTYPDLNVVATGILRPKDWNLKKVPSYEFELLERGLDDALLKYAISRLEIIKEDELSTYLTFPKEIPVFTGISKLGEAPQIITKTLEEMFLEEKETKEENLVKRDELLATN